MGLGGVTERRRALELRAAPGRRLYGTAMRYGAEALVRLADGRAVRERFAAFAFNQYLRSGAATLLNLQHDHTITIASTAGATRARGLLTLRDHPTGLDLAARLPSGDVFDKVLELVSGGELAETSVEFRALEDAIVADRRTVKVATLPAVGIVDAGAYGAAGSVETRRRGRGLRARVPYRKRLDCECNPRCSYARFEDRSFEESLADDKREVLAVAGDYRAPLASRRRGSLKLETDDDGLLIDIDLPDDDDNDAARVVLQIADSTGVYVRPYLDAGRSEYRDDGDLRIYSRAWIRALIIGATDLSGGLEEATITEPRRADPGAVRRHERDRERVARERTARSRRIWL